jgi:hypothetical protein
VIYSHCDLLWRQSQIIHLLAVGDGRNERLKMLEKRVECFQEHEREALSDDPITKGST